MAMFAIPIDNRMRNPDENELYIAVVPNVPWATEEEWLEWLTAEEPDFVCDRWDDRHAVALSRFETYAHAGVVSLADEPPSDEEIFAHGRAMRAHMRLVRAAIQAVRRIPVERTWRRETRLGVPFSGCFFTTKYLSTHAEVLAWAKTLRLE